MADVREKEEMQENFKDEGTLKEYAASMFEAAKDKGKEIMDLMVSREKPLDRLKELYCESKLEVKNNEFLIKKDKLVAKYKREMEAKMKRLEQVEKKLRKGVNSAEKARLTALRARLKESLKIVENNIRKEMEEKNREMNKKRSPKQLTKEMEKARSEFEKMSDEDKVKFAIKLDKQNKPFGKAFLNEVVDDNKVKLNEKAQQIAGNYLGRETKKDAREKIASIEMERNGMEFAKGKSTIEIGEKNAELKRRDFSNDPRKSILKTDVAKSIKKSDERVKNITDQFDGRSKG